MNYCRKHFRTGLFILLPCVAYNLYFIFLLPEVNLFYLIYLDMLLLLIMAVCILSDYVKAKQRENKKQTILKEDSLI